MELYPNLKDPVLLRDSAERDYHSRVEKLSDGLLVVARPRDLADDETITTGADISVAWSDRAGDVTVLPTRILAAHVEGALPVWSLVVTGPAVKGQRRRFPRAAAIGAVTIRSAAGKKLTVTGRLIDISEAAVHGVIGTGEADAFLIGANEVVAEFRLGETDFAVPGHVELLRATRQPTEFEEVVVVFDQPVADADALREHVLAHQAQDEGDDD